MSPSKTMRIGFTVPYVIGSPLDLAELAPRAEDLGFDSIWLAEHPVRPTKIKVWPGSVSFTEEEQEYYKWQGSPDGLNPEFLGWMVDPFIAFARASAVTSDIKLGFAICVIPNRHPCILAKEVATLDYFSNGRVIFGVGMGNTPEELECFGYADFKRGWAQTREGVLALKELWTKEEAEFHGKYYDFDPVWCWPKPAQKPHPPILLGGHARNVFKRIVAYGNGWIPGNVTADQVRDARATIKELAEKAGRGDEHFEIITTHNTLNSLGGRQFYKPRPKEELEALVEAGVDCVSIGLGGFSMEDTIEQMKILAKDYL